jgi:hypothetical protein
MIIRKMSATVQYDVLNSRGCAQVYVRQKNLLARRKANSCVPQAKAAVVTGPLTEEEKNKVRIIQVYRSNGWAIKILAKDKY